MSDTDKITAEWVLASLEKPIDDFLTALEERLMSMADEARTQKREEERTKEPESPSQDEPAVGNSLSPGQALAEVLDGVQVGGNHYKNRGIQPFQYSMENGLSAAAHNVIKYVTRHADKGKHQDLDKAIHCILMERAFYYPNAPKIQVIFPTKE